MLPAQPVLGTGMKGEIAGNVSPALSGMQGGLTSGSPGPAQDPVIELPIVLLCDRPGQQESLVIATLPLA